MRPTDKLVANKLLTENVPEAVTEIVTKNDTVSLYSLLKQFAYVTTVVSTTHDQGIEPSREIVTDFGTSINKSHWPVILFLLKHGCATPKTVFTLTQLNRRTVYRVLEDFRAMGLLHFVTKQKGFPGANHPGDIYGLPDYTEKQVIEAISLYQRICSPFFKPAERLAKDYMKNELVPSNRKELNRSDVLVYFMAQDVPPRNRVAMQEIVILLLRANGYKVWQ